MVTFTAWLLLASVGTTERLIWEVELTGNDQGFEQLAGYLKGHMGEDDLGASNMALYLAYFSGNRFVNLQSSGSGFIGELKDLKATWLVIELDEESEFPYETREYLDAQPYLVKVGVWETRRFGLVGVYRISWT